MQMKTYFGFAFFVNNQDIMLTTLGWMRDRYRDVFGYLHAIGVGDEAVTELRTQLLTAANDDG